MGVAAGGLALVAALLCRLLPETSNRPLPDTIHDVMEAYRDVFVNMLSMMGGVGGPEGNGSGGAGAGGGGEAENGRAARGSQRKRTSLRKAPLAEPEEQAAMLTDRQEPRESRRPSRAPAWTPDV